MPEVISRVGFSLTSSFSSRSSNHWPTRSSGPWKSSADSEAMADGLVAKARPTSSAHGNPASDTSIEVYRGLVAVTEKPSGRAGEQSLTGVVEVVEEGGVVSTISGSGSGATVGSGLAVEVEDSTAAAVEDDPGDEVAVVGDPGGGAEVGFPWFDAFVWLDSPVEQAASSIAITIRTATGRDDPEIVVGVGLEYLLKRELQVGSSSGCGAAWLARLLWEQEAVGSNPTSPTLYTGGY